MSVLSEVDTVTVSREISGVTVYAEWTEIGGEIRSVVMARRVDDGGMMSRQKLLMICDNRIVFDAECVLIMYCGSMGVHFDCCIEYTLEHAMIRELLLKIKT